MTDKEYNMTFGEWCNFTKGTNLTLDKCNEIAWNDPKKGAAITLYHDIWINERKSYVLKAKTRSISSALEALKKAGIKCELANYQNGHIKAKSKHGIKMSYYATTGTIAGYLGTSVEGLDEFIELCLKY